MDRKVYKEHRVNREPKANKVFKVLREPKANKVFKVLPGRRVFKEHLDFREFREPRP